MKIIKSGLFIEGVEVTSDHIGEEIDIVRPWSNFQNPSASTYNIGAVDTDNTFCLRQLTGDKKEYRWVTETTIDRNGAIDHWRWVDRSVVNPHATSTKPQREQLAETIRDAKAALDLAVREAEAAGMKVDISKDGVKITFNPPAEEY